ncbi:MAG TPA: tetratricopeptide repeat protein [Burkholderiales bacterium]
MALQNLDLEEQEQLAELKAWWKQYGNLVLLTIIAGALVVAGWNGWRWYQRSQAAQASALYDTLAKAVGAGDAKALRDAGGALTEGYPRTLYASMGALAAARFHFDRNELKSAKAQLQWVVERSPSEEYREIARLRLAHVLLDEKAYDEALKLLEAKPLEAYVAQVAALRGDVLVAKDRRDEAKVAYRLALDKAGSQGGAFRDSVQLRLDALGG